MISSTISTNLGIRYYCYMRYFSAIKTLYDFKLFVDVN